MPNSHISLLQRALAALPGSQSINTLVRPLSPIVEEASCRHGASRICTAASGLLQRLGTGGQQSAPTATLPGGPGVPQGVASLRSLHTSSPVADSDRSAAVRRLAVAKARRERAAGGSSLATSRGSDLERADALAASEQLQQQQQPQQGALVVTPTEGKASEVQVRASVPRGYDDAQGSLQERTRHCMWPGQQLSRLQRATACMNCMRLHGANASPERRLRAFVCVNAAGVRAGPPGPHRHTPRRVVRRGDTVQGGVQGVCGAHSAPGDGDVGGYRGGRPGVSDLGYEDLVGMRGRRDVRKGARQGSARLRPRWNPSTVLASLWHPRCSRRNPARVLHHAQGPGHLRL